MRAHAGDGREGAKSDGSSRLRLLIHAAFYERTPLQEVDGRVFLLGLRLALSLMLGHRRVLFLGGRVDRDGKRAGKEASREAGAWGFPRGPLLGESALRVRLVVPSE